MRQPVPFGKYLLLDRISVGGMAEVFKAKSYGVEGFEKIIAIKRILPTMGEDRDFIKMFIDEAKIAGQLAHANICQIFELGRIDGAHFIAMEYIWGKDLLQIQNRLRKNKQQMPVTMACFTIAKVLEGLDYAHRKRDPLGRPLEIVHRDCSPQNVLVSYEGEVKVIDFGIAKATSRNSRTMAGVLKGKFGYMSPEQVRGLPLDRRSDIFALGTMLFECLTGERLFQGETDFSTLEKVRNVDIQSPRSLNPNIPEAVERIILKALAKDVDDRYQWCSEMLADLQQFLMGQDVVFTAKSLSGWLKEMFSPEIDRERQQLEQYKRVGRDGLIAGVPAAQAKLDVVEHLGEAGVPEGDSTTLGGPNFDDIEAAAGAAPDVGPAPHQQADAEDDGDFGEEAPTEIFGDQGQPVAAAASAPPRAPTGGPAGKPPKPPPVGRPNTGRPGEPMPQPMVAAPNAATLRAPGVPMSGMPGGPADQGYIPAQASPPAGLMAQSYAQPNPQGYPQNPPQTYGTPSQPQPAMHGPPSSGQMPAQMPMGTPGALSVDPNLPQGGQNKTVLGMQAPSIGGYPAGNFRPSGQLPQQYPYQQPGYPPMQGYPPQQGGYPGSGPMSGYPPGPPATPVDATAPVLRKKSTLARDIGIGVAIAALVLVGFLAVKMFLLDKGSGSGSGSGTSSGTIATVRLSITPADVVADMFVDDKKSLAAVRDKQDIPVTAGMRRIKLVGPTGASCETKIQLDAGKTTTLQCTMNAAAGSAGSAAATGSGGSAQVSAGSAAKATDAKTVDAKDTKAADTKAADTKAADTKAAEAKAAEAKAAEAKAAEAKAAEAKAAEAKAAEAKAAEAKTKTTVTKVDVKASDAKTKTTDTKADLKTDTKTADAKATDPKADASKGYLQVFSKPPAKILVDGVETSMTTPISGHALSLMPGKHKVTFVIGDDRFTYPVTIKAGSTETMSKDLQ